MDSVPLKIFIYLASAILIFLGVIFVISTNLGITYFFEGLAFLVVAALLLVLTREKKPLEIKQTVVVTGPVKVKEVRCPNCSAIVDPTKPEIIAGKPYVTCSYCGNKFELTEEPKW
jgi:DNA-directed RNA polymerase subunit RPC12/RpoP